MKLQPGPFDRIAEGSKIIESRLYDEKRRQVELGDTIIFLKNPDLKEEVRAEVVGLLQYPSFEQLMADFSPAAFGGETKEALLEEIHQFYSSEEERQYGVLGIRLRLQ